MTRRDFLGTTALASAQAALPAGLGSPASAHPRPNIVLFMMDQLAAQWLWDIKAMALPNFDRLRARSVTFANTCVSNPVCAPARASLATGLRTQGHGVLQNGYLLDPTLPTFAGELRKAGWKTAATGKLHHRPQFSGVHPDYRPYGFDSVDNTEDARAGFWLDWIARDHPEYFDAALVTINDAVIPELHAYGPRRDNLSARIDELRGKHRWATAEFPDSNPDRYTLPFPSALSQTEWTTARAIDYLRSVPRADPFYAQISYVQPHSPSQPPADCMRNVDRGMIPAPAPIEWLNDPLRPRCFPQTEGAHQTMPDDWRATRHYYLADLTHLDEQLGRVMAALEATGRLGETYFILLSDHGELLLDHGFTGKGERHYDACVRVPLMIAGPGLAGGTTRSELVQLEDIFPTILEMAGLPMPTPDLRGTFLEGTAPAGAEFYPGRSLLSLCRGGSALPWRDAVEIESYNNIRSTTTEFWARTMRTSDYRYTIYPRGTGEQLFCLKNDPAEQHNLAADHGYTAIRSEMRDRLLEALMVGNYPHPLQSRYRLGVF